MSKGERNRMKANVLSTMAAQAAVGAATSVAGHRTATCSPTPVRTRTRRRRRSANGCGRLEPEPVAAPVVQRIFAEFVGGRGLLRNRRGNSQRDGIPSAVGPRPGTEPSPARNGGARPRWRCAPCCRTLATPGTKFGTSSERDEVLVNVEDVALGPKRRCAGTPAAQWVWSEHQTHPAIIDLDTLRIHQDVFAGTQRTRSPREQTRNTYVLSGMVGCRAVWPQEAGIMEPRPGVLPMQVPV